MQAIILAAGQSSRFWPLNRKHKSLLKIMGKPLIVHLLDSLKLGGIKDIIIVQGPSQDISEELKSYKNPGLKIRYVIQQEALGMGDALFKTKDLIKGRFIVLTVEQMDLCDILKKNKKEIISGKPLVFAEKTDTPELFGILDLKGNKVLGIVEKPKKGTEPSDYRATGVYILEKDFFDFYNRVEKSIYDFEEALTLYAKKEDLRVLILKQSCSLTLKYPWHLFDYARFLMDKKLKRYISKTAKIDKTAKIAGDVYIGDNVRIFENSVIKGPCYIGNNSIVGNNVLIREYCNIEANSLIGASSEITRTIIQGDIECHSAFMGDSIISQGCKFGFGCVTANVRNDREKIFSNVKGENIDTKKKSLGLICGNNTRSGVRSYFMPGKMVGNDCMIGPGTPIMENVLDNTKIFAKYEYVKKQENNG
ncbi:MAG TPA: NDP-sugar synthase [Candidatus Pacearchaeota archaeon]|nr:NDP-sugar synthase [Candidatus Pacearchaeota archaeon]HQI74296.1 NDP-sugar synthase [Candidatus Pacearchaeota archaeon]